MASRTRIRQGMTLEEFLELPDDRPYLEYIDGRIEAKVSPQKKHTEIQANANGSALGWLIDPVKKTIDVFRPDRPVERLARDGNLHGEPTLPGFRVPVAEVFEWLKLEL